MSSPLPDNESNKKPKMDVAAIAWEHYRDFLDSQEENDGQGDVDELVELLSMLASHVNNTNNNDTADWKFTTVDSLLPILCSVAHYHLADDAINQSIDQHDSDEKDEAANKVTHYLQQSLSSFPNNAATWSMGANYARMTQRATPQQICAWYNKAADCASKLRKQALELLEGPNQVQDDSVKEWIELLLLDSIVGAEYVDEKEEEEGGEEEAQEKSLDNDASDNNEQEAGYFSSSRVEATSRFMAAMLQSTLNKHDEARKQLEGFHLTHRLHPNVWTATPPPTEQPSANNKLTIQEPYSFTNEALPEPLYNRLCQVLAPDATYWKESDYAHRGYYSYFLDINAKPPSNLIEDVICNHLLPRAQHVLTSSGNGAKIVGAEWWPHTRPIQANLGHQMHFDTDEALLAQEGLITHPILSSVLYLTGNDCNSEADSNNPAGSTIVLDQTPDSEQVAARAWQSIPRDNRFMVFPGNKLHGVLPCPGNVDTSIQNAEIDTEAGLTWDETSANKDKEPVKHRLTFMVGFWTRCVPEKMKERHLYGPCGPLPPATDEHSWVKQIQEGYPKRMNDNENAGLDATKLKTFPLPVVTPAWESIASVDKNQDEKDDDHTDPPLELPGGIDHRFFVRGAPEYFRESLFHKD